MNTQTLRRRLGLASAVAMIGFGLPATAASAASPPATNDAAVTTATVRSEQPWTDTRIELSAGDTVLLQASGTINVFSGKPEFEQTPAGAGPANPTCVAGPGVYGGNWTADGLACWSLIARIGDGAPFFVGPQHLAVVREAGQLQLGVNDQAGTFGDNSGSWTVRIIHTTAGRPAADNLAEQFNQWLSACVEGELAEVDPGCEQAARDLAPFDLDVIVDCLTGNAGSDWVAKCGKAAGDIIPDIFMRWLEHMKPRI
jgi:hypothetical protein